MVYRYLETLKQTAVRASVNPARIQKYSANTAVWLFVRAPERLDEVEREDLAAFCQANITLKRTYRLVQDFLAMAHKREGHRLDAWLEQVAESSLPELQSFAAGVEKDKEAVRAELTWWINNGIYASPSFPVRRIYLFAVEGFLKGGGALSGSAALTPVSDNHSRSYRAAA